MPPLGSHSKVLTYRLQLVDNGDQVHLSPDEHDDFRWITLKDAASLPLVWHVARTFAGLDVPNVP